jgi:peroxiredoxin
VEVPHLDGWYRKYRKEGLIVIGLSTVSPKEQRDAAKRFGLTYPLFLWEHDKLPKPLKVITGYPTTLLIDRNGKIREVVFGILFGEQKEAFEQKIVSVLKEKPKGNQRTSPAKKRG